MCNCAESIPICSQVEQGTVTCLLWGTVHMHTKQTFQIALCFLTAITNSALDGWASTDADKLQPGDSIWHKSCTNFTFIPLECPQLLLSENVIQIQLSDLLCS